MNNFLALGALVACGWVFSHAALLEPTSRPAASRATTTRPAITSDAIVSRNVLEARRAPVPLVRTVRRSLAPPTSPDAPIPEAEQKAQDEEKAQDDLDRKAAKAAVEADGYKRATVVGKGSNGTWRAKAYRGTTEVQLTVDGTGRVSME
jgi:hypothetical protein